MTDTWLMVKEAAQYLKLSPDLICKLAQHGKIPASKVGTIWHFKKAKIDRKKCGSQINTKPNLVLLGELT